MDGGNEAVNVGMLKVATAFINMGSVREVNYIQEYNSMAERWRRLASLAENPNTHHTAFYRLCACGGPGCRRCTYSGTVRTVATCRQGPENCATCQFGVLCEDMGIQLRNMPLTGPWVEGYAQPEIPAGKSREGRFLPGQVVLYDITGLPDSRRVAYIVAALDAHDYVAVVGRQSLESGRGANRGWLQPAWGGIYGTRIVPTLLRPAVARSGGEVEVEIVSSFQGCTPMEVVQMAPTWPVPAQIGLSDYQEMREVIATR